jgi:hypothetical protein
MAAVSFPLSTESGGVAVLPAVREEEAVSSFMFSAVPDKEPAESAEAVAAVPDVSSLMDAPMPTLS